MPPGQPVSVSAPPRPSAPGRPATGRRRDRDDRETGVCSDGGELLAIDRDNEYRNSVTAAAAGVGAPVIEYLPLRGVLVLRHI
jgi:hypothetical protein